MPHTIIIFLLLFFHLTNSGSLFAFSPVDPLNVIKIEQKVRHTGNPSALRAFNYLKTLGIFKKNERRHSELKSFPYRGQFCTVTGELAHYFNWIGADRIRDEFNRIGIHYAGQLSRKTDFLIVGQNGSVFIIKKALQLGIKIIDESQFYRAYKKTFIIDRTQNLAVRLKKATHIATRLFHQMARDTYYSGRYKHRLKEFLNHLEVKLEHNYKSRWRFVGHLPLAGSEGTYHVEIDKKDLSVSHVEMNKSF